MAFTKVATLDTDNTVTIGGVDKKTGKNNPKSVEGYLLGTKSLGSNKFNKSKIDYLHILQTSSGNVGVWGKTHMDWQLASVSPGTMVRISFSGTRDVGKGNPMSCFLVEIDTDNTIEVAGLAGATSDDAGEDYSSESSYEEEEEAAVNEEEAPADEAPVSRAKAPARAAKVPSAARVKALLGGKSKSA